LERLRIFLLRALEATALTDLGIIQFVFRSGGSLVLCFF